jgi:hypothetical protein
MDWTSAKDKLPSKKGYYLCVCKGIGNTYMQTMRFIPRGTIIKDAMVPYELQENLWTVWMGTTAQMHSITHWMPLPAPPESK